MADSFIYLFAVMRRAAGAVRLLSCFPREMCMYARSDGWMELQSFSVALMRVFLCVPE